MSIRIMNDSVSVVVRGYGCGPLPRGDGGDELTVFWLEIAPQHPKAVGAIWASLVQHSRETLRLRDEAAGVTHHVRGLARRYHRLTADAPELAGRARPRLLRLIAPEACKLTAVGAPFVALAWPGMSAGTALAAMLEAGSPFPVRLGWGEYLLAEAVARGFALPLLTGGPAPEGYVVLPAPWPEIIADGVRAGEITLDGGRQAPIPLAMPQVAGVPAIERAKH